MKKFIQLSFYNFLNILFIVNIVSQSNPWLPPFNLTCSSIHDEEIEDKTLNCSKTTSEYNDYYNRFNFYSDNFEKLPILTIPINIIVWQKDDGSENWENTQETQDRFSMIFIWLNNLYNNTTPSNPILGVIDYPHTKVKFILNELLFYQNTDCWLRGSGGTVDGYYLNSVSNTLSSSSTEKYLNIHITGGSYSQAAGFAIFPSTILSQEHFIVTFNNEHNINSDYWFAKHFAHEIGHNLDLSHTYSPGANCNQTAADYLSDVFGTGSNAICPQDLFPTNNIMGGQESAYFSPKQIQSIHRALSLKSIRRFVLCEEFNNSNTIDITYNQTWDFDIKFYNSIVVNEGITLTIKCKVVLSTGLKIIVKPGGKLIIDGGQLTSECGDFWEGIEVWGNSNLAQNEQNQGTLIMKNGAIIENAHYGVKLWKYNDWAKTGGILNAQNSFFKNNWKGVEYMYYNNFLNSNNIEILNRGYIANCEFTWDDQYYRADAEAGISMYHVNGVKIINCFFADNRTANITTNRAQGIITIDAGFKVYGYYPTPQPWANTFSSFNSNLPYNHFKNLEIGINASNSSSDYSILVDNNLFENCIRGIYVSTLSNAVLVRNKFEMNENRLAGIYTMYGLSLSGSSKFKVEGNNFIVPLSMSPSTFGCQVHASGMDDNQIYRNTFQNMGTANYAKGINSHLYYYPHDPQRTGLQWLCNQYNQSRFFDQYVYIEHYYLENEGIKQNQGTFEKPAKNIFSDGPITKPKPGSFPFYNFYVNDDQLVSYFHGTQAHEKPVDNCCTLALYEIDDSNTCPSSFSISTYDLFPIWNPIRKNKLLDDLTEVFPQLNSKKIELSSLLTVHDATELHVMVENMTPSTKMAVKISLLLNSPYLSTELIKKLANKAPGIFPNAWLKEVIQSNLELVNDKELIIISKTKTILFPRECWLN